jgi:aspartate 1-decarboxylase
MAAISLLELIGKNLHHVSLTPAFGKYRAAIRQDNEASGAASLSDISAVNIQDFGENAVDQ